MRHAEAPRKLAAYEEVRTLPHYLVGEALDGVLYVSAPPIARKQGLTPLLGRSPAGWWWTAEPRLLMGQDVLVPDLAGWMGERPRTQADGLLIDTVPDWVCEVLTPASARLDLGLKLPRYAKAGIRNAWIVNPVHRVVEVFHQVHERWVLSHAFAGEDRVRAAPFGDTELLLTPFWTQS
jgi:Uma2 family endonuclease